MSMTAGYGKQDTKNDQVRKERPEQNKRSEEKVPHLQNAVQLIQSGARISDLSPEQLMELAETAGNQTVLELFRNGSGTLSVSELPRESEADPSGLPENEIEIRWPALVSLPETVLEQPLSKSAWPVEQIRPMGAYEGGPEIC